LLDEALLGEPLGETSKCGGLGHDGPKVGTVLQHGKRAR
ncbi:MAG: hypothetical protein RL385_4658, partial [Pseudomonadota bacterium]